MRSRAAVAVCSVVAAVVLAGCSSTDADGLSLPESEAEQYPTAYLSRVEPAPEGDDLAEGAGEFLVIEQNADIRLDMGGWFIEDADGNQLNLGIGRQIDPGAELRVFTSCGDSTNEAVFACSGGRGARRRGRRVDSARLCGW